MKKMLKSGIMFIMLFSLFAGSLSGVAKAAETTEPDEQQVEELANQMEFIFEKALIRDENGNPTGIDVQMIEDKYGSSPELDYLKLQIAADNNTSGTITTMDAALDKCINKKVKNGFGEYLKVSTYTTIIDYITSGNYSLAAKRLLKLGVRGNAAGLVAQLTYYYTSCMYSVHGW